MESTRARSAPSTPARSKDERYKGYWKENVTLMIVLLAIWFAVSFGAGILFRETLDNVSIGTAPLGFWFAQQGSIFTFVALIWVYVALMGRIERRYADDDQD